jgi:hypothetical protein
MTPWWAWTGPQGSMGRLFVGEIKREKEWAAGVFGLTEG